MFNDSHLFETNNKTSSYECLLRIEKKLDRLIDLLSANKATPLISRYTFKGIEDGECIFEDEYGCRITEDTIKNYQEAITSLLEKTQNE